MRNNNQSNRLIKWMVTAADFLVLFLLVYAVSRIDPVMAAWSREDTRFFLLANLTALFIAELWFHTIIHERVVMMGDVLRRVLRLCIAQTAVAYVILRAMGFPYQVGWWLIVQGALYFAVLMLVRYVELNGIKWYRKRGGNTRTITFVGSDPALKRLRDQLVKNPATGYQLLGYYADEEMGDSGMPKLGSLQFLLDHLDEPKALTIGDELYVCVPRQERDTILRLSRFCDSRVVKFFYIPLSSESVPLNFQREFISDIEVLTTHESPLEDPLNKIVKRFCDIVLSVVFLLLTALIWPFVALMIKLQSPGPVLFRQQRTGLGGKPFTLLKFRSMRLNSEADTLQATQDDSRVFPFGKFLRKTSLDELPQFWNVLKGDMSIVGPRPHMLAHTETYSKLIDKYMVRHFVKPGITGWAQVTGYRGETKELWQMDGRVQRDIWYMEHWSIWLDIRIIGMTIQSILRRDKNA